MAFRMNRPVIKGTTNHKASIAKAKTKAVVSQARTKPDQSLIGAAEVYGKSFKPKGLDFSFEQAKIDLPKGGKTKKSRGKTDYGTYDQYVKDHEKQKGKMSEEDKAAYGEPLSKEDWTELNVEAGMKRPKAKKERVKKERVKKEKVKKEKEPKVKKDTWYSDVDEDGNIISRTYQSIKDKIRAKREQKELDFQAEQEEKSRIQAEKDALEISLKKEADRIAEEKRLATLKAQQDRFKENPLDIAPEVDLTKELLQSIEEKKGEDIKTKPRPKEIVRSNIITQEDIDLANERAKKAAAYDPEDERVYTKEDRERLVFDERTNEMRLPEEIEADKTNYNTSSVVEEKKTLSNLEIRKKRMADRKYNNPNTSQYIKDQMIKEGYVPDESKTAMNMRDDRIYRNAIKGGAVQQNMIKGGYIPPNKR